MLIKGLADTDQSSALYGLDGMDLLISLLSPGTPKVRSGRMEKPWPFVANKIIICDTRHPAKWFDGAMSEHLYCFYDIA